MKLADFVEINPRQRIERGREYPCVMMDDVMPGRRYVTAPSHAIYKSGSVFQSGDTLFARITPCLENGKIAQFKDSENQIGIGSTEFVVMRAREGISDEGYVYYLAASDLIRKPAEKSMFGASGRQRADINVIREIEINPPELDTQHRIASILSAYDDLIENNMRRIQILEEMVRMIYREWFVQMRFPGHTPREDGKLPDGWQRGIFTDFISVGSGGTPRTNVPSYWDGDVDWFSPPDIQKSFYVFDTKRKITELGLANCNSNLYPAETVFITARGTVGKCVIAAKPMAMSQTSYALNGKGGLSQYFVYLLTLSLVDAFKKQATGAVFDTIVIENFRKQEVVVPADEILFRFTQLVSPMFTLIKNFQQKNASLRRTRDLLLPKLVGGEIDVSGWQVGVE